MQAYEFYAIPDKGAIIIPDEYKGKIVSGVKVIILDEKSDRAETVRKYAGRKSDVLLSPFLDTKGWKFDREKANER